MKILHYADTTGFTLAYDRETYQHLLNLIGTLDRSVIKLNSWLSSHYSIIGNLYVKYPADRPTIAQLAKSIEETRQALIRAQSYIRPVSV